MKAIVKLGICCALLLLLAVGQSAAATYARVEEGNISCKEAGVCGESFVINESPFSGSFDFPDGINHVNITMGNGGTINWTSTIGIDAVIIVAGDNSTVYTYPCEAIGDSGLRAMNATGQGNGNITRIEFCYDYDLVVAKSITPAFTRTYNWTLNKTVTPEVWNLFLGDTGTSIYTINATRGNGTDSNWGVSGTIYIENPTPFPVNITGVSDMIIGPGGQSVPVSITGNLTFPITLAPNSTITYTYNASIPNGSPGRINLVNVVTENGRVRGGFCAGEIVFCKPTTEILGQIHVNDTGNTYTFNKTGQVTYNRTFNCTQDGTVTNTATIQETGQSDSASVQINCYELEIAKTVATAFNRTYAWNVSKVAEWNGQPVTAPLNLSIGNTTEVDYEVSARANATDSNWRVTGNISVHNPAPIPAVINSVTDIVSSDIAGNVTCNVTFPYNLTPNSTLNCTYTAQVPNNQSTRNLATVRLQNHAFRPGMNGTSTNTTLFNASRNVTFQNANIVETDRCVQLNDTFSNGVSWPQTVCINNASQTFTYTRIIGPYNESGQYEVENVASIVGKNITAPVTITIEVPPGVVEEPPEEGNCTLTQGYWSTHSSFGPAPYDDTWAQIGENTIFYNSSQTWYQVLTTPPAGNAYYILASQYIAARLNQERGADTSVVAEELARGEELLQNITPTSTISPATRQEMISIAETLDQYNNGQIGPGRCD
jgi:hypothetical protein